MNAGRRAARMALAAIAASSLAYAPRIWASGRIDTSPQPVDRMGLVVKVSALLIGVVFAVRCARLVERENPTRRGWWLVAAWFAFFTGAQATVSAAFLVLGRVPLPSIADPLFLGGYAAMIAAALLFIRAYRRSGFPIGSDFELASTALVTTTAGVAAAAFLLPPIAAANEPFLETALNVGYPIIDLVSLVPVVVLLRIAFRFGGGRVGHVWRAILLGYVFVTLGDLAFAYASSVGRAVFWPIADIAYVLGYASASYGATLQHELLSEP